MTDDPRIDAMIKETGFGRWRVEYILAKIDGVDPLRQVRGDRVEAALDAYWEGPRWRDRLGDHRGHMTRALAAADRVQAPAEKPDFPPWSREVWDLIGILALEVIGPTFEQRKRDVKKLRAAFPETQDAG